MDNLMYVFPPKFQVIYHMNLLIETHSICKSTYSDKHRGWEREVEMEFYNLGNFHMQYYKLEFSSDCEIYENQ